MRATLGNLPRQMHTVDRVRESIALGWMCVFETPLSTFPNDPSTLSHTCLLEVC
jgi:hypothetical protein